jgi:hypothetical protein
VLASGSVPGFFPPVHIDVEAGGKRYTEMHVDGGTTCSVFLRPFMLGLDARDPGNRLGSNVYVIASGKLFADAARVDPDLFDITTNALTTLLYAQTRSDLNAIYGLALETGMNYRLAAVPADLPQTSDSLTVDPKDLRSLYEAGYQIGRTRAGWQTKPPDAKVRETDLPRTGIELDLKR